MLAVHHVRNRPSTSECVQCNCRYSMLRVRDLSVWEVRVGSVQLDGGHDVLRVHGVSRG